MIARQRIALAKKLEAREEMDSTPRQRMLPKLKTDAAARESDEHRMMLHLGVVV